MARRIMDETGITWEVMPSGHRTQYASDELTLAFQREGTPASERRFVRISPRGAKAAENALEELTDRALVNLLHTAQPAWTSPDGGYARPG